MTWNDVEKNWQQFQPLVRRHWFRLSEADIAAVKGKRELLTRRIVERYGMSAADAEREIEAWVWMVKAPRVGAA